jgi:hypothetical protein
VKKVAVFTTSRGDTLFLSNSTPRDGPPYLSLDPAKARTFADGEPCPQFFEFHTIEEPEILPRRAER